MTVPEEPDQYGPWRCVSPLGAGAMGTVWRVEHIDSGAVAALKTASLPNPTLLEAVLREVRALSRLRHPGVVSILDHGEEDGTPWFAMEMLSGNPLSQHVPRTTSHSSATYDERSTWCDEATVPSALVPSPDEPIDALTPAELDRLLRLMRRICDALAYLHGEGIVHRDIKPDNILVCDGWPVLVDLGLATRRTGITDTLSSEPTRAGTPLYMAPESILGQPFDSRADLYALGCVFYELLVGRPPFGAGMDRGILVHHLMTTPTPPSAHREGVPDALDALVLRLLAKEPAERLPFAEDVGTALERLGAPQLRPSARPWLHRPPLHGRDAELGALHGAIERLDRDEGSVWWLEGPSGAGKTRLARDAAGEAERSRFLVLRGRAPGWNRRAAEGAGAPLLAHLEAPLRALGHDDLLQPDGALGPTRGVDEQIARIVDAFTSTPRPLFLVIDDLQWADQRTLDVLERLAGRAAENAVMLVGTARPGGVPAALANAAHVRHLRLSPLSHEAIAGMAEGMLARPDLPAGFADTLHRASGGVPCLAAELLKGWLEEERFERHDDGGWLPRSSEIVNPVTDLHQAVTRRLDHLPAEAHEVLGWAALGGTRVQPRQVARVTGRPLDEVEWALTEGVRRQFLTDGPEGLAFAHDSVLEASQSSVTEPARAHAAWAEQLAAEGAHPGRVARHQLAAGDTDAAKEGFLRAERICWEAHDPQGSLTWLDQALQAVPPHRPAERLSILWHRTAVMESGGGSRDEIRRVVQDALAEARAHGLDAHECEGRARWAELQMRWGEWDAADQGVCAGWLQWLEHADDRLWSRLAATAGALAARTHRPAQGVALLRFAQERARAFESSTRWRLHIANQLGSALLAHGDVRGARDTYREVVARYEALDDDLRLGAALNNVARLDLSTGQFRACRSGLEQAMRCHTRAANHRSEAMTLTLHAVWELTVGEPEQAQSHALRAVDVADRWLGTNRQRIARGVLARSQARLGDAPAAHATLRALAQLGETVSETVVDVLRELGDVERAAAKADELMAEEGAFQRPDAVVAAGEVWLLTDPERAAALEHVGPWLGEVERPGPAWFVGHARLATGRSADDVLAHHRAWLDACDQQPSGELARRWRMLTQAQAAFSHVR